MKALVVVDMLEQFVTGDWANKRAQAIVSNIVNLAQKVKDEGGVVVATKDNHLEEDFELAIWGNHAMVGTKAAEVIPEIATLADIEIAKRTYDSFYETNLDQYLKSKEVSEVILAGVLTNICVRHTAFGAFVRGYKTTTAKEIVEVLDLGDEVATALNKAELATMEDLYGTRVFETWVEI